MKRTILFAAALVLGSTVAQANELLISQEKAGNASAVGIDFVSDGDGVAFEALIDVGTDSKVDVSKCLVGVPKSHTGACVQIGNKVKVMVYSLTNAKLPAGVISVGQIGFRLKGGAPALKVEQVLVGDSAGKALPVTGNAQ